MNKILTYYLEFRTWDLGIFSKGVPEFEGYTPEGE